MKFEELPNELVNGVLDRAPRQVRLLLAGGAVLAGGIIRDIVAGLFVKDVDIFCQSEAQAETLAIVASPFVRRTTFAYTVELERKPVQFIFYKEFATPGELISQFDFRACCAGIYWSSADAKFRGIAVEGFYQDCQTRVLRFMSQKKDANKLTALRRALNFAGKGWTISEDELTAIITHFEPSLKVERVMRSFRPAYGRI